MEGPRQSHNHYLATDFMRFYGHDCRLKTKNIAIRQINQHSGDIVKMMLILLFHLFIAVSDDYHQIKQMWTKRITAQKMKFSLRISSVNVTKSAGNFYSIWSHLLKKSLMENFILCAVDAVLLDKTWNI